MTSKCPYCGAPGGKAHVCRQRFAKTEAPKEPKARKIAAPVAKAKPEPAPAPAAVAKPKRNRLEAASHPDCEYCKARRERAKGMMQDLRKRRAKEKASA